MAGSEQATGGDGDSTQSSTYDDDYIMEEIHDAEVLADFVGETEEPESDQGEDNAGELDIEEYEVEVTIIDGAIYNYPSGDQKRHNGGGQGHGLKRCRSFEPCDNAQKKLKNQENAKPNSPKNSNVEQQQPQVPEWASSAAPYQKA